MVLITPYRPLVAPVPQIQPHLVETNIPTVTATPLAAEIDTVSDSGWTNVWEEDFTSGWETRIDWAWRQDDSNIIKATHPSFNGFTGIDVTYPAGSLASRRWGGMINLPNWPTGYEEGRFDFDIMLHSNYSVPVNQKSLGVYPPNNQAFPSSPPPACDEGWLARLQFGDGSTATDPLTGPQPAHLYHYSNQATRVNTQWGGVLGTQIIEHDVVNRIRLYWKMNSAFNLQDGIIRHLYDAGTASTHAEPTTIQAQVTNMTMYCGSEANRSEGTGARISVSTFFGGPNDPVWAPNTDSKFTLGRLAVDIPA